MRHVAATFEHGCFRVQQALSQQGTVSPCASVLASPPVHHRIEMWLFVVLHRTILNRINGGSSRQPFPRCATLPLGPPPPPFPPTNNIQNNKATILELSITINPILLQLQQQALLQSMSTPISMRTP